jgi:hypothetical protein
MSLVPLNSLVRRPLSFAYRLVQLFNPPPLSSLSLPQKFGRIVGVSFTLFALCILAALALASGIFIIDRAYTNLSTSTELLKGLEIVVTGLGVNVVCVAVLLEVRKADLRLHPGLH